MTQVVYIRVPQYTCRDLQMVRSRELKTLIYTDPPETEKFMGM